MSEKTQKELKRYLNKNNLKKVLPPILAIDYGRKSIGMAITDKNATIASPLEVYKLTKQEEYNNFASRLIDIINEYNIQTIVVGLPQQLHKKHIDIREEIITFSKKIEKLTNFKIFLYDETYSTVHAYQNLREEGIKQKKAKKCIDKFAAANFLQELIDFKNKEK